MTSNAARHRGLGAEPGARQPAPDSSRVETTRRGCRTGRRTRSAPGKTTTVRILSTLLPPDAGRAAVAGFDVVRDRHRVRRRISLTGQYPAVEAC